MKNKLLPLIALIFALPQSSSGESAWRAGTLQNPELDELSGLVASHQYQGVYWGVNDSGNSPLIYALSAEGRDLGQVRIPNMTNRDPEALGYGNCAFAPKCIYIADIGDNRQHRREVRIELIPEPSLKARQINVAKTVFVTYPNGAINAEAMLVRPADSAIMIIEKVDRSSEAAARVFWIGPQTSRGRQTRVIARQVATVATETSDGGQTGPFTDAAFRKNGTDFYLRDYRRVYRATGLLGRGEVVALMSIPSPAMMIGEAIAVSADGSRLVISSEGRHAPIATIALNNSRQGTN